jgi:hypothetical protein
MLMVLGTCIVVDFGPADFAAPPVQPIEVGRYHLWAHRIMPDEISQNGFATRGAHRRSN